MEKGSVFGLFVMPDQSLCVPLFQSDKQHLHIHLSHCLYDFISPDHIFSASSPAGGRALVSLGTSLLHSLDHHICPSLYLPWFCRVVLVVVTCSSCKHNLVVPRFHTATKLFLLFPLPFSFHEVFCFLSDGHFITVK